MKMKVCLSGLILLGIASPLLSRAAELWKEVLQSSGGIESAVWSASGEILVLEQARYTRLSADQLNASSRDLLGSQRIALSPGGSTYALITYEGVKEEPNAAELTLFTAADAPIWSLSHHDLNDIYPLDNGAAVAVRRNLNVPENTLYFFSSQGEILRRFELPAVREIWTSPSADRVLVNSGRDGAILYNAAGEELLRCGPAYRASFSRDGRWFAVLAGNKVTIFHDTKPTYTGEMGGEIVRGVSFSPDNTRFIAFTDHALYLLKNPGGEVLLRQVLEVDSQLSFTSADVSREGGYLVVGIERDLGESVIGPQRHPDGLIALYRGDGFECCRKAVSYSRWNTTTPRIIFSHDGSQILTLTRDEILIAPLKKLCAEGGER
jgi:WD40 repeat protein